MQIPLAVDRIKAEGVSTFLHLFLNNSWAPGPRHVVFLKKVNFFIISAGQQQISNTSRAINERVH